MISRLHIPVRKPEDVREHLGSPRLWKEGRSAYLLAHHWFQANALPATVRHTLAQEPRFKAVELVDAFFEKKIELGDRATPSQADLLAVLGIGEELAVMAVEGKVTESFGPFVSDWLRDAEPPSRKQARLKTLSGTLGIDPQRAGNLRYQLIHRTASAIYEARRYRARVAVMMVHSFDPDYTGIDDYARFARALSFDDAGATRLSGPVVREGVELYLGWTADRT